MINSSAGLARFARPLWTLARGSSRAVGKVGEKACSRLSPSSACPGGARWSNSVVRVSPGITQVGHRRDRTAQERTIAFPGTITPTARLYQPPTHSAGWKDPESIPRASVSSHFPREPDIPGGYRRQLPVTIYRLGQIGWSHHRGYGRRYLRGSVDLLSTAHKPGCVIRREHDGIPRTGKRQRRQCKCLGCKWRHRVAIIRCHPQASDLHHDLCDAGQIRLQRAIPTQSVSSHYTAAWQLVFATGRDHRFQSPFPGIGLIKKRAGRPGVLNVDFGMVSSRCI